MSTLSPIVALLSQIGLADDTLQHTDANTALRDDLALSSVETTELQLLLGKRHGVSVDLWDRTDYTLGELAALVTDSSTVAR